MTKYSEQLHPLQAERDLLERLSLADSAQSLLEVLTDQMQALAPVDGVLFNFLDEERQNLVCEMVRLPGAYAHVEDTYLHFKFPLEAHDANVVSFREGTPLLIDASNVEEFPGTTHTRFFRWSIQSLLVFSFSVAGETVGTVMLFSQTRDLDLRLANPLQALVERYGRQIMNALATTRLRRKSRQIERAMDEQRHFLDFITRVNNIDSTERICEEISQEFLRRGEFELAGVLLRENEHLVLKHLHLGNRRYRDRFEPLLAHYREHPFELNVADGATPTAFLQDAPMYFPDTLAVMDLPMSAKDARALQLMRTPRTIFMCPIRRKGRPMGLLWLISLTQPVRMSEHDRDFYERLCSFIGTAMGNAQLYEIIGRQNAEIEALNSDLQDRVEQLGELASRDRLTGLHNFGYFEGELERRVSEYQRNPDGALSVVIFDVDHFKRFNDTYGHLAGNEVLKGVAQRLEALARKMDLACRYGGEEFVVLLPQCEIEGARRFADRLRQSLENAALYAGDPSAGITISAGCATYTPDETADTFLERADQALYRAKASGRNRVESAS